MKNLATNESRYRKMVVRSVLAVAFFIFVFLLLLLISIGIFLLLGLLAVALVVNFPNGKSILLAAGIVFVGGYLLKLQLSSLFKQTETFNDHLIEIKESDEPELFAIIREVAVAVGTKFPKSVFLSASVNAGVFYEPSMLGLFFPRPKSLAIGIGLLDSVTITEFKAILAHEFGHFSQKSMKVGNYVSLVNRSIYSVVTANQKNAAQGINNGDVIPTLLYVGALVSSPFVYILEKTYSVVNKNYLALSREMEFHADAIAAEFVGSDPIRTGLLRLSISNEAYNYLIDYYQSKVEFNVKTAEFYPQMKWLLGYLGKINHLEFEHDLPSVTLESLAQFNKSKLNIENQWESHPSLRDRINAINSLNFPANSTSNSLASTLFKQLDRWQLQATKRIFYGVKYKSPTSDMSLEEFSTETIEKFEESQHDSVFYNYYQEHLPFEFDIQTESQKEVLDESSLESLFSNSKTDYLIETKALDNDIEVIQLIGQNKLKVPIFEYDGKHYRARHALELFNQLKQEYRSRIQTIQDHDVRIFHYFLQKARKQGKAAIFIDTYLSFENARKQNKTFENDLQQLLEAASFLAMELNATSIFSKVSELKLKENPLKSNIRVLISDATLKESLETSTIAALERYISQDWKYFERGRYNSSALEIFENAIRAYPLLLETSTQEALKRLMNAKLDLIQEDKISNPN